MSKEEIIAAIRECAEKLGRTPTLRDLETMFPKFTRKGIRLKFGNYAHALEACGFEVGGGGFAYPMHKIFRDWAAVVRKINHLPSLAEYDALGEFTRSAFMRRFGYWRNVPQALKEYMVAEGLEQEYADVLEIIKTKKVGEQKGARRLVAPEPAIRRPILPKAGPVFGMPLTSTPLVFAPRNEAGVLLLFGMMAERLGFIVTHVQAGFPDCLALLKLDENSCQLARIEIEYESRNFLEHGHQVKECDMIVCWIHNWKECPLPVVELKPMVMEMMRQTGETTV